MAFREIEYLKGWEITSSLCISAYPQQLHQGPFLLQYQINNKIQWLAAEAEWIQPPREIKFPSSVNITSSEEMKF